MRIKKGIEWSTLEDSVLIVNPETRKVITGNKSVCSIFRFCASVESFTLFDIANHIIQGEYACSEFDSHDIESDIKHVVDMFVSEGVIINDDL